MMKLYILIGEKKSITIKDGFVAVFGRDEECDICIPSKILSRQHGEFYVEDGDLYVRDLGSKNGISINGENVSDELVQPDSTIEIAGKKLFALKVGKSSAQSQKAALVKTSQKLTKVQTSSAALQKVEEPAEEKLKKHMPILIGALVGMIALVVVLSLKGGSEAENVVPSYDQKAYFQDLNNGAKLFSQKKFDQVIERLSDARKKFDQNDAAQILTELAEVWVHKGDLYQQFNWAKAESLCSELLEVHPGTESTKKIAQVVLKWIGKEEPVMAQMQRIIRVSEKDLAKAFQMSQGLDPESKIVQAYQDKIDSFKDDYIQEEKDKLKEIVTRENWQNAIDQINVILEHQPDNQRLKDDKVEYNQNLQDEKSLKRIRNYLKNEKYELAEAEAGSIKENSLYYKQAQRLLKKSSTELKGIMLQELYKTGNGSEAIEYAVKNNIKDPLTVSRINKVLSAYVGLQDKLKNHEFETVVKECDKILLLEEDASNFYVKRAQEIKDKWSDTSELAKYFVGLGDKAYQAENYKEAEKMYRKAQSHDDFFGSEGLNLMNKNAIRYYNKAISAHNKKNTEDAKFYLRKALKQATKDSQYYDSMVKLAIEYAVD